ncbi:MAG: DMT family transporter [Acidobacteriota bacterium]|nr:DMT family transporter [Acidobacteriota bacterium]
MTAQLPQPEISHARAVLIIALVATVWGFGFPATHIVLSGGLSVGALMGLRFPLAGLVMFVIIRANGIAITRRGVLDGIWLGLVLVLVFWLQTDGMRFTTTAKAGFITGLYVLFTPLIAVVIGQRVKLASALGALIAVYGMYLLVHLRGAGASGHTLWGVFTEMNRGDVEILLCAILCGVHIVMMGAFSRRSEAWLLAGSQVMICGVVSVAVTAFLPSPDGFQNAFAALSHWPVALAALYLALGSTVFAFWGQATAQTRLGPTESAVLFSLEPVVAAVLSVVWLKEPMSAQQALGGALIVVAMIVAEALPRMFRAITVPDTRP